MPSRHRDDDRRDRQGEWNKHRIANQASEQQRERSARENDESEYITSSLVL